jgi:hypothetical protein
MHLPAVITYYANPSTEPVRAAMRRGQLGLFCTPVQGNSLIPGVAWAGDCGGYTAKYAGDEPFLRWLATRVPLAADCAFITAPDVVGDAAATLRQAQPMLSRIRRLGFPAAYVAQNGSENTPPPWGQFDVLFLGGLPECPQCRWTRRLGDDTKHCPTCGRRLTEWKTGPAARDLTRDAGQRGVPVHMGRVNSLKRLRAAHGMGCASADGTILAIAPDRRLPEVLSWVADVNNQNTLWPAA